MQVLNLGTDLTVNDLLFFPHYLPLIIVYVEKSDDLVRKRKSKNQSVKTVKSSFLHSVTYPSHAYTECLLFVRHYVRL